DQSTHLDTVHKSVKSSLAKLDAKHKTSIDLKETFKEVEQHIKATDSLDTNQKQYALNTLERARKSKEIDLYTGKTIGETLATVWAAAKDDSAYGESENLEDRKARMNGVVRNLYLANREYNMNEYGVDDGKESVPACLAGHVNKIVEALDRIHPDVVIIQSQTIMADYTLESFDKVVKQLPEEDQIEFYKFCAGQESERGEEVQSQVKQAVKKQIEAVNIEIFGGDIDTETID